MSEPTPGALHVRQVGLLLRRRWRLVSMAVALAVLAAGGLGLARPPLYTAKAQLLYDAPAGESGEATDSELDTLVELLLSPGHLRAVLESLADDPLVPVAAAATPTGWRDRLAGTPPLRRLAASLGPEPALPTDVEGLQARLLVYKERRSRLVAVACTGPDGALAAALANRVAGLHLEAEARRRTESRERSLERLEGRVADAREALDRAELALRAFRLAQGLAEGESAMPADARIAELVRQRDLALEALARLEEPVALALGAGAPPPAGSRSGRSDAAAPTLVADAVEGPPPPEPPSALSTARAREALAARLRGIEDQLRALEATEGGSGATYLELRHLEREVQARRDALDEALRRESALAAEGTGAAPARLVTLAAAPAAASSPGLLLYVAPAFVAALILGGLGAILLERMDRRLRSAPEVESALGLPCIGLVPRPPGGPRAIQATLSGAPFSAYSEAIRSVVSASLRGPARPGRVVLVTSTGPREGKTGLAVAYAAYAALIGRRVLLMDLNFRRPGLAWAPEGRAESVPDYLHGAPVETALRRAEWLGLDLLSLPPSPGEPLAALSDPAFPALLDRLRQAYDLVVVDSAALTGATEARVIAGLADEVLLAVRWRATEAGAARRALGLLGRGADAAVLTDVDLRACRRLRYDETAAPAPRALPEAAS